MVVEDGDLGLGDATGTDPGASPPPQVVAPTAPQPQAAPAQPVPPQAGGAAQPPAPTGNEASTPRSSLDEALEGFKQNSEQLAQWASTELFKLSPKEVEALNSDAVNVIPALMGRAYAQALTGALNMIRNFVPNMITEQVSQHVTRTTKSQEALNEFYSAHPHLNPKEHGALVDKWVKTFRTANPKASRQDAIKFVGTAVATELGLAPPQAQVPVGRQVPFAPARPGVRMPTVPQADDPYAGMDVDFD